MQAFFGFWASLRLGALAALLLAAVAAAGCGAKTPATPVHLVVGWDTSAGARPRLSAYVELGARLIRRCRGAASRTSLFRMDCATAEFFDAEAPTSLETLQTLLVRELQTPASRPGTYPHQFWEAAADCADRVEGPVVVALLTDGGNDDRSLATRSTLRKAVQRLANNARVRRVCVWGVLPTQREELRADLTPLADRLELRGLDDASPDATVRELAGQ